MPRHSNDVYLGYHADLAYELAAYRRDSERQAIFLEANCGKHLSGLHLDSQDGTVGAIADFFGSFLGHWPLHFTLCQYQYRLLVQVKRY